MKTYRIPKVFGVLLLAVICFNPATSFARLPKPIVINGTILAIDLDTRSLVFKAGKDQKPFVLDWNDETAFTKDGQAGNATSFKAGTVVVIHYKNISFRNPLLKKVVWEESKDAK